MLILDACPGRDFAALFALASGAPTTEQAALADRIRHLERVARLVWDRRNRGACIRCGERHQGDSHEGRTLLPEADVAWSAPVRVASPSPAAPDVKGGLEVAEIPNLRQWVVCAVPIGGRGAAFGVANRKRDARALRDVLLDEVPGRDFRAMFTEGGMPVDAEASRPVYLRLKEIGEAAITMARRQRDGECPECGMRSCPGVQHAGTCDPDGPADLRGRIPAELRRWV